MHPLEFCDGLLCCSFVLTSVQPSECTASAWIRMGLFCLKDLKLKTKKHPAFRNGVALLANENARIQEKSSICERLKGSREMLLWKPSWSTMSWFPYRHQDGKGVLKIVVYLNAQIILFPHQLFEFAASLQGCQRSLRKHLLHTLPLLEQILARGAAPPKGNVPKLMLGSHVGGTGEHLEVASLEQEDFLFTASMGIHGWGIMDLHWPAVLTSAPSGKEGFFFSHIRDEDCK